MYWNKSKPKARRKIKFLKSGFVLEINDGKMFQKYVYYIYCLICYFFPKLIRILKIYCKFSVGNDTHMEL